MLNYPTHRLFSLFATLTIIFFVGNSRAQVKFTDNFDAGASPLWGNQSGSWTATGGVYAAQLPSNSPTTYSSLPFALTDFAVDVDINHAQDGGLWLRSSITDGVRNGVLLVTGGFFSSGTGLYWHTVTNGSFSSTLNEVSGLFTPGVSDPHIRVEVVGDTYTAFVNGSTSPATTLTTTSFTSGEFGLYSFSNQTFDNVVLVSVASPCDLNRDGAVDAADAGIMFGAWGTTPSSPADKNKDGFVDAADAGTMFADWTGDSIPTSVPEPATSLLAMSLGLGVSLVRREVRKTSSRAVSLRTPL